MVGTNSNFRGKKLGKKKGQGVAKEEVHSFNKKGKYHPRPLGGSSVELQKKSRSKQRKEAVGKKGGGRGDRKRGGAGAEVQKTQVVETRARRGVRRNS